METRFFIFITILATFSGLELILCRRKDPNTKGASLRRKVSNFSILIIGSIISAIIIKIVPVLSSEFASSSGLGLLHHVDLPLYIKGAIAIIFLDMAIYFQHRVFHSVNFLWRLHIVHHIDNQLDSTTALRFHPLEIIISLFVKSLAVLLIGATTDVVIIFEVILSSMAIFNHANIQLPKTIELVLRYFLVTPNFHVTHHHPTRNLHDSNFGFNLSIWDYLFRTYRSVDSTDFSKFECGIENRLDNSLKGMLLIPFK